MRLRRLSGVAVVLSVALLMAGCSRSAPPITDEQVEAWHALGEEMIPLATEVKVEASEVTTMGGNSNWVDIEVSFADFDDLEDSDPAVEDFEVAVREQVPRAAVATRVLYAGAEALEVEVAARLLENLPGLTSAYASSRFVNYLAEEDPALWVTPYVYLTGPEVIDPAWLDDIANHTQYVASRAGGQIDSIVILPADVAELDLGEPEVEQALISVQNLPAFAGSGAESGCVRTDAWVYDVSNDWVIVHPASEPDGACA